MGHDYAELGNRSMPHVRDILDACRNKGLDLPGLKSAIKIGNSRKKRKTSHSKFTVLITSSPAPAF